MASSIKRMLSSSQVSDWFNRNLDIDSIKVPSRFVPPPVYTLGQTYLSSTTYTVPTGVTKIAVYCIGKGGNGATGGATVGGITSGNGSGGGSGGALAVGWEISVSAGNTFTVTLDATKSEFTNGVIRLTASNGQTGTTSTSSPVTPSTATQANVTNNLLVAGAAGPPGVAGRNTDGTGANGNAGQAGNIAYSTALNDLGLPTWIRSGAGGASGGAGSRTSGTNQGGPFYYGGIGGVQSQVVNTNSNGGDGGYFHYWLGEFVPGANGNNAIYYGNGGGGGGGGGLGVSTGGASSLPGNGGTGAPGVIYVYERRS